MAIESARTTSSSETPFAGLNGPAESNPIKDAKALAKLLNNSGDTTAILNFLPFKAGPEQVGRTQIQTLQWLEPIVATLRDIDKQPEAAWANCAYLLIKNSKDTEPSQIFESLTLIIRDTGTVNFELFQILEEILGEHPEQINRNTLSSLVGFCEVAQQDATIILETLSVRAEEGLYSREPLNERLKFMQVLCERITYNRHEFVELLFDIASSLHRGHGRYNPDKLALLGELMRPWSDWTEIHSGKISQNFSDLLGDLKKPFHWNVFNDLWRKLPSDPSTALQFIDHSRGLFSGESISKLSSHFLALNKWVSLFGTRYCEQICELLKFGIESKKLRYVGLALDELSKIYSGERVGSHLKFLQHAFERMSFSELGKLKKELTSPTTSVDTIAWNLLTTREAITYTPLTYLVSRLALEQSGDGNPFPVSEKDFYARWKETDGRTYPSSITIPDGLSFNVRVSRTKSILSERIKDVTEKALKLQSVFKWPGTDLERTILQSISKTIGVYNSMTPQEPLISLLVKAMDPAVCSDHAFDQVVKQSRPLLARAFGAHIPYLNNTFLNGSSIHEFLAGVVNLLDSTLPDTLERRGAKRDNGRIDRFQEKAELKLIQSILNKAFRKEEFQTRSLQLFGAKNAIDRSLDLMCEACSIPNELARHNFQPLRIQLMEKFEIVGGWYLLRHNVGGKDSLIMAGGGPNSAFDSAMTTSEFVEGLIDNLWIVARHNGCKNLYSAYGTIKDHDFSRMCQTRDVGEEIARQGAGVITVDPIYFPTDYSKGPIRRLIVLREES